MAFQIFLPIEHPHHDSILNVLQELEDIEYEFESAPYIFGWTGDGEMYRSFDTGRKVQDGAVFLLHNSDSFQDILRLAFTDAEANFVDIPLRNGSIAWIPFW